MEEETKYLAYLVPAFGLVWAAVFGYVYWLSRKRQRLERDIESLRELLKEDES
jgi:CcmD family protein